jgi:hypothetical protein
LGTAGEAPTSLSIAHLSEVSMLKVIGWIVGIIFLIGLLVIVGVFDLIF